MQQRRTWTTPTAGLVVAALWVLVLTVALHVADPVVAAYQAQLTGPFDAQDPPALVARAERIVGVAWMAALPAAVVLTASGAVPLVRDVPVGAGRVLSWVAMLLGAVALLPALVVALFGLVVVLFP